MAKSKKAAKPADAPTPKDLDTQIKEASAELGVKPVQAEALAGTHNALSTHLHIKGLFNSIYTGIVLGGLVASAAGIIFSKVDYMDRIKLIPTSARALVAIGTDAASQLQGADPRVLAATGLVIVLVIVCWFKRKVWPIGYLITRLVLLVFWVTFAYWLLAVLGLGEAIPRWPNF